MILTRLLEIQGKSAIPMEPCTFFIEADVLAYVEEMAEEIGISKSAVIRECVRDGVQRAYGEWQQALESGKKRGAKK